MVMIVPVSCNWVVEVLNTGLETAVIKVLAEAFNIPRKRANSSWERWFLDISFALQAAGYAILQGYPAPSASFL